MHVVAIALSLAWVSAGKSIAAKIAMMAMTTNSSIKVKAIRRASRVRRDSGFIIPQLNQMHNIGLVYVVLSCGSHCNKIIAECVPNKGEAAWRKLCYRPCLGFGTVQ